MPSVLYFSHVPWGWIKQRPHFLAEELARHFDVELCYRKAYRKGILVENGAAPELRRRELFVLPFARYRPVEAFNEALVRRQLSGTVGKHRIVWFTAPDSYGIVRGLVPPETCVVYDCMDDYLEFPAVKSDSRASARIMEREALLVSRSDLVISSSQRLGDVLVRRYGLGRRPSVVNNAVSPADLETTCSGGGNGDRAARLLEDGPLKKILYLGTLSAWVDFSLVRQSLDLFRNLMYVFVGPSEVPVPRHERIVHAGPVPHGCVSPLMRKADALVMPFVLNPLVDAVNPVKLYEYIHSGKPALAVRTDETRLFEDYVHLYSGREEYLGLLGEFSRGELEAKRDLTACRKFVEANTWEQRADTVAALVRETLGDDR